MTDTFQLVAAATAPTLMVLVGILINNSRLGDMNSRLGDMNSRLVDMNSRLGDFRAEVNTRFADLHADINRRFDDVDDKLVLLAKVWDSELGRVRDKVEVLARR